MTDIPFDAQAKEGRIEFQIVIPDVLTKLTLIALLHLLTE